MIRQNVRFAFAAKGRVIVATGRMEPIHLGEHVPYVQGGDTLTVITDHAYGDGNAMVPLHNIYPSVHVWDWRTATRLRSLSAAPPTDRN